eukprot:COSAG06_NODE_5687_length_3319_cov_64.771796_3_plen_100_part_00
MARVVAQPQLAAALRLLLGGAEKNPTAVSKATSPTSSTHGRASSASGFAGTAEAGATPSFAHSPSSVGAQLAGLVLQLVLLPGRPRRYGAGRRGRRDRR